MRSGRWVLGIRLLAAIIGPGFALATSSCFGGVGRGWCEPSPRPRLNQLGVIGPAGVTLIEYSVVTGADEGELTIGTSGAAYLP